MPQTMICDWSECERPGNVIFTILDTGDAKSYCWEHWMMTVRAQIAAIDLAESEAEPVEDSNPPSTTPPVPEPEIPPPPAPATAPQEPESEPEDGDEGDDQGDEENESVAPVRALRRARAAAAS